jgi:hypothetical protein
MRFEQRWNVVSNPKMTTTKDKAAYVATVAEQVVLARDGGIIHVPQVAARHKRCARPQSHRA